MENTSNADTQTIVGLGSTASLGSLDQDFKDFCAKEKLRPRTKDTINTTTWETTTWFTIEMRVGPRKYLPLRMPDNSWFWRTAAERDEVLAALVPNASGEPPR